jgi:hypothetical protein
METLGVAPSALSGTMQFPEQQQAAQRQLEDAKAIGSNVTQGFADMGLNDPNTGLRANGINIPAADAIQGMQKLRGLTIDDLARQDQGLDKNLTPADAVKAALGQRTQDTQASRAEQAYQESQATKGETAGKKADDSVFAADWQGANLDSVASNAGKSRQWVIDAAAALANNPQLKAATYDKLLTQYRSDWKKADLTGAINNIVSQALPGVSTTQAQQLGLLLRGLLGSNLAG